MPENGTNGHLPEERGKGAFQIDPHHVRRDMGHILRALNEGWLHQYNITAEDAEALPKAARIGLKMALERGDPRAVAVCVEVMRKLHRDNFDLARELDSQRAGPEVVAEQEVWQVEAPRLLE